MIVMSLIFLLLLVYVTVKLIKMVWPNEKVVILMLITLCMTMTTMIFYYSFLIIDMNHPSWFCNSTKSYTCTSSFFSQMPAFFLAIAVILNLNKWIYFKLRISAFIKVGFGVDKNDSK